MEKAGKIQKKLGYCWPQQGNIPDDTPMKKDDMPQEENDSIFMFDPDKDWTDEPTQESILLLFITL